MGHIYFLQKLREEKNLNKGQVSYVLSNPIPEKTATLNKDFNQKNEDMQRKIDETEKLLVIRKKINLI